MNKRKYIVIIGSKNYFEENIPDKYKNIKFSFMELIKLSDNAKTNNIIFNEQSEILILRNDNYHGITEQAHDRIGQLLEELTCDDATIYIHNPTLVLHQYLENLSNNDYIDIKYLKEEYYINKNENEFVNNIKEISKSIIGQEDALIEISKSMWYLTRTNRKKPYVIMLYGDSSLGKTELVREIASKFYNNKFLEQHLSMYKNDRYSDYFFGEKPNRKTLGYDLLGRESNLIFFDELDKCPEYFYSAFYTLFDNEVFTEASYKVDISSLFIILTSNYKNKDEMKDRLGLPIYNRIDKFIQFNDFNVETIKKITLQEIKNRSNEFKEICSEEEIFKEVSKLIEVENENARTIKCKIQSVIENKLFESVKKNLIEFNI